MSASIMPTRPPALASAIARFTATVVLPTPPLPAPTAMMFFTPGSGARPPSPPASASRTRALICTSTLDTPGTAITAARAWSRIWSLTGHAGVVSSMVKPTRPDSILRSLMNPRLTMSRWRSGSWTTLRTSKTLACSTGISSRIPYAEDRFPLFAQQHPQRVTAESGAVRQEQQIDRSGHQREQPGAGTMAAEGKSDQHVAGAPNHRDDRQREERDRRQTGRDMSAAGAHRRGQRRGPDAERERRQPDQRRQRTPHNKEDADEV